MRNVFEAILECGHDEDFAPVETGGFSPPMRQPDQGRN